jgi:hypothetical protein
MKSRREDRTGPAIGPPPMCNAFAPWLAMRTVLASGFASTLLKAFPRLRIAYGTAATTPDRAR